MVNWYAYSLIALLLLGGQRFLYKVVAERHCSSGITTAVFMLTVTFLSGAMLLWSGDKVLAVPTLLILSLGNSSSFALATIANIESLKYLPAGISFPLTRLSLVVVVFVSVFLFDEQYTLFHWCGLALACAVVVMTALDIRGTSPMTKPHRLGFFYIAICILCGAIAAITSKLAAVMTSKSAFMCLSYAMGTIFSLAIEKKWGDFKQTNNITTTLVLGIVMGFLNFLGFFAFLTALEVGPLSTIAVITGMHFVVAIVLSVVIYHERLSTLRCLAIIGTILTVIVLGR